MWLSIFLVFQANVLTLPLLVLNPTHNGNNKNKRLRENNGFKRRRRIDKTTRKILTLPVWKVNEEEHQEFEHEQSEKWERIKPTINWGAKES